MSKAMFLQVLIRILVCLLLSVLNVELTQADAPIARPGCKDTCGNVKIPFPFGIGAKCSLEASFEIECKASPRSNGSTKPFLSKIGIEVMEVNINYANDYESPNIIVGIPPLNGCAEDTQPQQLSHIDLRGSPYNFSTQYNVFIMEGCPGSAALVNQSKRTMAGCATVCYKNNSVISANECYGVQCCQSPLSSVTYSGFPSYEIDFNLQRSDEGQNCLVATLIKTDSVNQYVGKLSTSDLTTVFPVVLSWSWISNLPPDYNPLSSCSHNKTNTYCECKPGYYGNPFVSNGCQVPEECKGCRGHCLGRWDSAGRLISSSYSCEKETHSNLPAILGLGIGFGIVLLALGLCRLYYFIKRRREMKQRAKCFKRNGGLLLQQHLSSDEGVYRAKIFNKSELDKATDNFNENRVLGQGGQGTVYKGMLIDGKIVAIKKSKMLDENQLEQFINEVVILSQINHRNVVKLLGCCLETEVPLLVYEFIPNGTLSQHIHNPDDDFAISWEMRLKIAANAAGAIAYLHSSSSIPVYHRDIKSSNILLDDKYRAKVSDFGSSKTIAFDQTHMTTLIQGTLGYLDPEYVQSYQFTEKSDVYSFGVVLLELLTGKKPIYRAKTMEPKNLVTEFLYMIQNSLSDILDPQIVKNAKEEELIAFAHLAKRCLSWRGKMRPTMKEVTMRLEMITKCATDVSTWDKQDFLEKEFGENPLSEISDITEFMSHPLPSSSGNPLRIDVHPLQAKTI